MASKKPNLESGGGHLSVSGSETNPAGTAHGQLVLENISQVYGAVTALDDVSLSIDRGEFVTLLGPSGCGKTTLLRSIAGFQRPTSGRILLAGKDVTGVPAHKRPTNMVFQRSALFPHLDVASNVGFGLRIAGVSKEERAVRVSEALELVRLGGFEARRSTELSGGQMQRVSLARALVNRPEVLLLDEPLSALDLKIRLEMEVELRRVHQETGATFVYVTHDQREALALSDRIVVLNHGRIEQIGKPGDVYRAPASSFAARFVGNANVVPVELVRANGHTEAVVGDKSIPLGSPSIQRGAAWLVIRPEVVRLGPEEPEDAAALIGTVQDIAYRGSGYSYLVDVPGLEEPLKAEMSAERDLFELGATVAVTWGPDAVRLLTRSESG